MFAKLENSGWRRSSPAGEQDLSYRSFTHDYSEQASTDLCYISFDFQMTQAEVVNEQSYLEELYKAVNARDAPRAAIGNPLTTEEPWDNHHLLSPAEGSIPKDSSITRK